MSNGFKTGTDQTIKIPLTFQPGDEIGNYSQIVVTLFYDKPRGTGLSPICTKFAWFALVPGAGTLDQTKTYSQITIEGTSTLVCELVSTLTDNLLTLCGESVTVKAEIDLGSTSDSESTRKAGTTDPVTVGVMKNSVTKGWS